MHAGTKGENAHEAHTSPTPLTGPWHWTHLRMHAAVGRRRHVSTIACATGVVRCTHGLHVPTGRQAPAWSRVTGRTCVCMHACMRARLTYFVWKRDPSVRPLCLVRPACSRQVSRPPARLARQPPATHVVRTVAMPDRLTTTVHVAQSPTPVQLIAVGCAWL